MEYSALRNPEIPGSKRKEARISRPGLSFLKNRGKLRLPEDRPEEGERKENLDIRVKPS